MYLRISGGELIAVATFLPTCLIREAMLPIYFLPYAVVWEYPLFALEGHFCTTFVIGETIDGMVSLGASPSSKNAASRKWDLTILNGLLLSCIFFSPLR